MSIRYSRGKYKKIIAYEKGVVPSHNSRHDRYSYTVFLELKLQVNICRYFKN